MIGWQQASGGEIAFNVHLEMEGLKKSPKSPITKAKEQHMSFVSEHSSDSTDDDDDRSSSMQRRGGPPVSPQKEGGNCEVLRCTSNSSFQKSFRPSSHQDEIEVDGSVVACCTSSI